MPEVTKALEELKNIAAKKAANTRAQKNLQKKVSDSAINDLDNKIIWHSKISDYVSYALGVSLLVVGSLSFYGYLRLDDKIGNEIQFLSQRLDEESRFTTQRIDEERRLNTQRLDSFSNNATQESSIAAPIKRQVIQSK